MSSVESAKSSFFPAGKVGGKPTNKTSGTGKAAQIARNDLKRTEEIEAKTGKDAKVDISDAIKDFARIKKAVDTSPEVDNTAKIANLKKQINEGTYQVDYDGLADKILSSEF